MHLYGLVCVCVFFVCYPVKAKKEEKKEHHAIQHFCFSLSLYTYSVHAQKLTDTSVCSTCIAVVIGVRHLEGSYEFIGE